MNYKIRQYEMTSRRIVPLLVAFILSLSVVTVLFAQTDSTKQMMASGFAQTHAENVKSLNSSSDEAAPFLSADGNTIYFSSCRLNNRSALFSATRASATEWAAPKMLIELEGKQSISVLTVAADGRTAVVQCCNRPDGIYSTCDLYMGDLDGGELKNLRPFGAPINSEWWEGQPSISSDGQLLFFSSDRKHGEGGSDIYMMTRNSAGDWSEPVNLKINTGSNEVSPFIASDNQTLYFASDRSGGQGGYDIYVTYRKGDNEWSEPKNLGAAVNTKSNELFFSIPSHEDAVYVSSDREGGQGGFDIWKIVPNPVKPKPKFIAFSGRVLDAVTGQPIATNADVSINISATGEAITNTGSAKNYKADVPIGKPIRVTAMADGYASGNVEVQTPDAFDPNGFSQDIKLNPTKIRIVGHTTDLFTNKKIADAKVTLEEIDANGNSLGTQSVQTDADAAFGFDAKVGAKYRIAASANEYQGYYQPLDDIPLKREASVTIPKEIRMTPNEIKPITVNFETAKYDLMPSQLPQFNDFIRRVKDNPYVKLEVQGYTDERGSEELNRVLSEKRAKAVQDYLQSQGVPANQLAVVKGYGKSNPLDPSSNEEAWRKNRRCEIRIVGK